MSYFVYIVRCKDGSLYAGCTNDIVRRVKEHNTLKQGAHYTKIRRPVTLVYSVSFRTYAAARKCEAAIKRLSRKKKLELTQQRFRSHAKQI